MGYDLFMELQAKDRQLQTSLKMLRQTGEKWAAAERDYKSLLMQETLKLKDSGMSATLIDKVIYGLPSVADLRFKRDVALITYKANTESINVLKLQMKLLDNQIAREWGDHE